MRHIKKHIFVSLIAFGFTAAFGAPAFAETSDQSCEKVMIRGSLAQINATHATVKTSILIDASPALVWDTLTDFNAMSDWSTSTLQTMTGNISDGGIVEIIFIFGKDENGEPNVNKIPHTLIYKEGESFGWSDPFPANIGGGSDNHIYRVQACGDKTLFIQNDEIMGTPYAGNFVAQLLPAYQLFNAELKAAVESR